MATINQFFLLRPLRSLRLNMVAMVSLMFHSAL